MIRQLFLALFILFFLCSSVFAAGNKIDKGLHNKISLSNKFYTNKTEALLLKTGQTTSYHADDDGDLELGIAHSFTVLTTGQYAGSTNVTINSKTHVTSNACVRNENTGNEWLREVIQADIGPDGSGKLFWDQWTLAAESCTFATATDTITAAAGAPFSTTALCVGRKITISGTTNNNGVVTVTNITTTVITVSENLTDEGPVNTTFATKDDTIWNLVAQANIPPGLAGYTDWRIPNLKELLSLVDYGQIGPAINTTIFPSTPSYVHWTSSTYVGMPANGWTVTINIGGVPYYDKSEFKCYVRLVRN